MVSYLSLLLISVLLNESSAWPGFRGADRSGYSSETGLMKQWPADGPKLLWSVEKLGGGYSTPSIAGGKIFGMSYRGDDEVVWALNAADGSELWSTRIAGKGKAGYNEGPRSTPTIDGDRLYAVGISGDLVCLKIADGSKVWAKNYGKDFKGRMMSGWGFSESPLVVGEKLICTPGADDAAMVALHKLTGEVIWKGEVKGCGGAGYASPVTAEVPGTKMVLTWFGKCLAAVNLENGKFLWRYETVANKTANIPTPVVSGDKIFASTSYGAGSALLKLVAKDGGVDVEALKVYPGKDLQVHHGGFVKVGDYVYGGHGHNAGAPFCIEFATGKIQWKEDRGPGSGSAATLYADGVMYFRYQDGSIALVAADPEKFKLLSKFKLPKQSGKPAWAHPVIVDGKLYLRDQDVLLCYDVRAK